MANLHLIKSLAEKRNLPITELAERVGVSEQQIHTMARTNSTRINTLEKIAKVLEVPVTVFFEDVTPKYEKYESNGKNGILAKNIGTIDNRDFSQVREDYRNIREVEIEDISEEFVIPPDCPSDLRHYIDKISLENKMLNQLLKEKERLITHLLNLKQQ